MKKKISKKSGSSSKGGSKKGNLSKLKGGLRAYMEKKMASKKSK